MSSSKNQFIVTTLKLLADQPIRVLDIYIFFEFSAKFVWSELRGANSICSRLDICRVRFYGCLISRHLFSVYFSCPRSYKNSSPGSFHRFSGKSYAPQAVKMNHTGVPFSLYFGRHWAVGPWFKDQATERENKEEVYKHDDFPPSVRGHTADLGAGYVD